LEPCSQTHFELQKHGTNLEVLQQCGEMQRKCRQFDHVQLVMIDYVQLSGLGFEVILGHFTHFDGSVDCIDFIASRSIASFEDLLQSGQPFQLRAGGICEILRNSANLNNKLSRKPAFLVVQGLFQACTATHATHAELLHRRM
jgi:hypothetical protein